MTLVYILLLVRLLWRVATDAYPGVDYGIGDVDMRVLEALRFRVERGRDEIRLGLALLEETGVLLVHPILTLYYILLLHRLLPLKPYLVDSILSSCLRHSNWEN